MRDSDWLKNNLRLIFLFCVQMQILCNGAIDTQTVQITFIIELPEYKNNQSNFFGQIELNMGNFCL